MKTKVTEMFSPGGVITTMKMKIKTVQFTLMSGVLDIAKMQPNFFTMRPNNFH